MMVSLFLIRCNDKNRLEMIKLKFALLIEPMQIESIVFFYKINGF